MPVFDVVVVGGGVAGLSAAAAAAASGLSCVLVDPMCGGGELMNLGVLHDCPDLPPGTTGPDLAGTLLGGAAEAGVELSFGTVRGMERRDASQDSWTVRTDDAAFDAAAVIVASGLAPGTLGLSAEDGYEGSGLSHCAACDGPLYRGRPVAVAGCDRWAVREAEELAAFCAGVTLITQGAGIAEVPGIRVPGIRVLDGRVVGLEGATALERVVVGLGDGATESVPAQGLFVQSERGPALGYAPPGLSLGQGGTPRPGDDSPSGLPRVFVAGSVRLGSGTTVSEVMADGRAAASAAVAALRGGRS